MQPLHEHQSGEGASKKSEQVTLIAEAKDAFGTLGKACFKGPVLAFADFDKPFLLETGPSKLGLGAVLSQKETDGQYHPVACASWSLAIHEHNYHSTKQEFFSTKVGDCWAVSEIPTLETVHCQNRQQSSHLQ